MAGDNKPEFPPLLPPGLHPMDTGALRRFCVLRFRDLVTRLRIMDNLDQIIEQINKSGVQGFIWIDGSFLTEKLNPDDADIALIVSSQTFNAFTQPQRDFFHWFRRNNFQKSHRIDNYGVIIEQQSAAGELWYAYWLRQFGFSRADQMKGIVTITVPFVVAL